MERRVEEGTAEEMTEKKEKEAEEATGKEMENVALKEQQQQQTIGADTLVVPGSTTALLSSRSTLLAWKPLS